MIARYRQPLSLEWGIIPFKKTGLRSSVQKGVSNHMTNHDYFEKLYHIVDGLNRRFPDGNGIDETLD